MILKWIKNFNRNKSVDTEILVEAIHSYRKDGKELMYMLAEKYGLDITIKEDYEKLVSRSNLDIPRRGQLTKRWNYYFHGMECGFHNSKSRKDVEVILTNSPEFGKVESWFLLSYMKSIEKYRIAIEGMDWQNLELVINELYLDEKILKASDED